MRFGPWHRLHDAAAALPEAPGVLQVRREAGLVRYPRGRSAMLRYAAAPGLRAAAVALATTHPDQAWLLRGSRDPLADPDAAALRLLDEFVERFGGPPAFQEALPLADPEARWERSVPLPELDPPRLRAALGRWPALLERPWSALGGGLRSLNLRIGDVVARVATTAPSPLPLEAALLRAMHGRVRVPRVIDAHADVLLLEHVEHTELPASAAAGARVGATAAAIHAWRFADSGPLDEALRVEQPFASALAGLHGWVAPALAGAAGVRLGPLAPALERCWARHAAAMQEACRAPVLLHADFKPANLKWLPATREVLVLDWEFAWAGPALFDLGQLLRWDPPEDFIAGFERGYRAGGGSLPDGWRRLAACFDLFNLVDFLGRDGVRPRRDADALARVSRTLTRLSGP